MTPETVRTLIIITAEAVIGGIVGIVFWVMVTRRIERRDQETDELRAEIKELREEKFAGLQTMIREELETIGARITGEAQARRDLDQKVQDDFARSRELTSVSQTMTDLDAKVNLMSHALAESNAITKLIASHLNINFRHPGKS